MKALVVSIQPSQSGYRIAQVVSDDSAAFDVAEGMFWVDCGDLPVIADQYWYDPEDKTIKPIPMPEIPELEQPVVDGAQTL